MKKIKTLTNIGSQLLSILNKKQKKQYYFMVFLGIVNALLEVAGISVLLHTVLSILRPDFIQHNVFTSYISKLIGVTDQLHFVGIISGILLLAYIIKNIIIVQINKAQVKFAYDVSDVVSEKRYNQIANSNLEYFKNRKSTDIINELFGCTLYLPETVIIPSIMLLSELMILFMILGGIFFYKPFLFVFTFLTAIPTAGILIYYNKTRLAKKGKQVHEINPQIYDNIVQLTQGISNIKLWNVTDKFKQSFDAKRRESFNYKRSIYVSSRFIPMRIYEVVAISGILCVVLYAMISNKGSINLINYVSIYAGVSFRLLPGVNRVLGSFNSLATNSFILEYFNVYKELTDKPIIEKAPLEPIVFKDSIVLENIHFSYSNTTDVLRNISLEINKTDYIGIVGLSGSGKSTLMNVISSLYTPNSGALKLDGKLIDEDQIPAYRYLFSYVRQDVFMLNASILDNIAFLQDEEDIDMVKVKECIKKVHLDAWVDSLEEGLDTQVGELASKISGGQKQRIAIARALYKNAEVFIFDEVTNNLDAHSTKQTLSAIEMLKKEGKTAIFITHKKDELSMCNKTYHLEDGRLVEKK